MMSTRAHAPLLMLLPMLLLGGSAYSQPVSSQPVSSQPVSSPASQSLSDMKVFHETQKSIYFKTDAHHFASPSTLVDVYSTKGKPTQCRIDSIHGRLVRCTKTAAKRLPKSTSASAHHAPP